MSKVFVVGCGMIPVGKYPDESLGSLGGRSIAKALSHCGLEAQQMGALYAGNMMSGQLCKQQLVSALLAQQCNLVGKENITAESACASGAAALRLGFMSIASGCHDAVIVCGVEKMTHSSRHDTTQALATASDHETEGSQGETFLTLNARLMKHYLDCFELSHDHLADFSINAHRNACTNPNALFRKSICKTTYDQSKDIAFPIKLYDAPAICDGAATIILANESVARSLRASGHSVAYIRASAVASDNLALANRRDHTRLRSAEDSARLAYKQAGITPKHVDFFEPHDAYTIMTALSLEAAGFVERGASGYNATDEHIGLRGELPICTFGGLKARGHPVGATGVYQMAEAYLQLCDEANENQVEDAHIGMIQNFSGTATVAFTNIIERI